MALRTLSLALLLMLPCSGQAESDESFEKAASQILKAARSNSRGIGILRHLTDRIGPRLSGSAGAEAAVEWTAARMRADGLRVSLQPVKVPRWIRGEETGELLTPFRQELSLTGLGGSVAGYYLAEKKLPSSVIAFSTNSTGESAWLLLGLTGIGYMVGIHAVWVVLSSRGLASAPLSRPSSSAFSFGKGPPGPAPSPGCWLDFSLL